MKTKLCDINADAEQKLPKYTDDKSGIGVHYVDAYLKPMNTKLEDGSAVKAKRRGLKVTLTVGAKKGDGLMRRRLSSINEAPIAAADRRFHWDLNGGRPADHPGLSDYGF